MRNKMLFAVFSVLVILVVAVSPAGRSLMATWMAMAIPTLD